MEIRAPVSSLRIFAHDARRMIATLSGTKVRSLCTLPRVYLMGEGANTEIWEETFRASSLHLLE